MWLEHQLVPAFWLSLSQTQQSIVHHSKPFHLYNLHEKYRKNTANSIDVFNKRKKGLYAVLVVQHLNSRIEHSHLQCTITEHLILNNHITFTADSHAEAATVQIFKYNWLKSSVYFSTIHWSAIALVEFEFVRRWQMGSTCDALSMEAPQCALLASSASTSAALLVRPLCTTHFQAAFQWFWSLRRFRIVCFYFDILQK